MTNHSVRAAFATVVITWISSTALSPHAIASEPQAPNWKQVAEHATWSPRDSCGECVLNGRMYLIGGWLNSFEDGPRDVWSSADGKEWKLETKSAPWKHADLSTTLVFDKKMWLMGGWHGGRLEHATASNETWSSTDGANWKQETAAAGWSPRLGAAGVVFKNRMWILGGLAKYYFGDDKDLHNDVWSSADGVKWEQATPAAPWPARAYHGAAALGDKMYIFSGGNYLPGYKTFNDVWSSTDGKEWVRETEKAPWEGRIWFTTEVYRGRMWLIGGWSNNPFRNWNDVWHSADGKHWEQLKTETVWNVRHEHSSFVLDDKLWVTAGNSPPLVNDTWQLHLPERWAPIQTPVK